MEKDMAHPGLARVTRRQAKSRRLFRAPAAHSRWEAKGVHKPIPIRLKVAPEGSASRLLRAVVHSTRRTEPVICFDVTKVRAARSDHLQYVDLQFFM